MTCPSQSPAPPGYRCDKRGEVVSAGVCAWCQGLPAPEPAPTPKASFTRADMDAMRDNARWKAARMAILSRGDAALRESLAVYDAKYSDLDMRESGASCNCQGRVSARAGVFAKWREFINRSPLA